MLAGTAMAAPGCLALMAAATSSQGPGLREEIVTLAPCSAMRSAMALPMPRVEPVTMATLPVRSKSSMAQSLKHPFDLAAAKGLDTVASSAGDRIRIRRYNHGAGIETGGADAWTWPD